MALVFRVSRLSFNYATSVPDGIFSGLLSPLIEFKRRANERIDHNNRNSPIIGLASSPQPPNIFCLYASPGSDIRWKFYWARLPSIDSEMPWISRVYFGIPAIYYIYVYMVNHSIINHANQ